ncbi:unnamed protein product [Acanthoscelides obtectus]|uniref:Uncharacterized protein n=1 Tax=Acanthoscelides obtectus TaxID=200917 RepID=A0A9P0PTN0_ACAOB|nr:unnamed protein product [Acanthoscelides obtectus]CAK1668218.1 hypothetical protein AOBTE_LOCUS26286 [Acanthoscelides obtectus]
MSDTHEDLDEFLEKFKELLQSKHRRKKIENDLLQLTERLNKELESSESNAKHWESCYKVLLSHDNATLTTKHVELKGKYENLALEYNNLKLEFAVKEKQYQEELELQKTDLTRRLIDSEEKYESEIINFSKRIESDRMCYETKEKELLNEIQATQATTALQIDEIESNLKSKIADLNNKLRQSQTQARTFQTEIAKLKNLLANQRQRNDTLYFQETPIQTVRNNLMYSKMVSRDTNNIYTESEEDANINSQRPPSRENPTFNNVTRESNIDNISRNINTFNINTSASQYSDNHSVIDNPQSVINTYISLQTSDHNNQKNRMNCVDASPFDQNNNSELSKSRIFQQKSTATPEKFQQLSCQAKTFELNNTTCFQRHTSTPLYKGKAGKKNYVLQSNLSNVSTASNQNKDVKNKPRKRKLYDPEHNLEPNE